MHSFVTKTTNKIKKIKTHKILTVNRIFPETPHNDGTSGLPKTITCGKQI